MARCGQTCKDSAVDAEDAALAVHVREVGVGDRQTSARDVEAANAAVARLQPSREIANINACTLPR